MRAEPDGRRCGAGTDLSGNLPFLRHRTDRLVPSCGLIATSVTYFTAGGSDPCNPRKGRGVGGR
jgi:hypothetical protein